MLPMSQKILPEDIARHLDPFSRDPEHAIDMIRDEDKPIGVMLHLDERYIGDKNAYGDLARAMEKYGGEIDPFMEFTDVIGFEPNSAESAKQIVRDQCDGRIPYVSRVSIDSMALELSSQYRT